MDVFYYIERVGCIYVFINIYMYIRMYGIIVKEKGYVFERKYEDMGRVWERKEKGCFIYYNLRSLIVVEN